MKGTQGEGIYAIVSSSVTINKTSHQKEGSSNLLSGVSSACRPFLRFVISVFTHACRGVKLLFTQ